LFHFGDPVYADIQRIVWHHALLHVRLQRITAA
jgi:hypothetical protein